jgi:hypothetical protein
MPYLQNLANFPSFPLALAEKMREYFRDLSLEELTMIRVGQTIIRVLAVATMAATAYFLAGWIHAGFPPWNQMLMRRGFEHKRA